MAVDNNYQQQYQDSIVGAMMPALSRQKKGMYDFLLQNSLRTGQSATSVAEGLRPYAEASGQAAAEAGIQATGMAQRQTQFDEQQALHRERMEQQQTQWQSSFDQRNTQQNFVNAMNQLNAGIPMTPEMMDQLGYGDMTRQQQRDIQKQMKMLGMDTGGGTGGAGGGSGGARQTLGSWNNWGGQTGLIYG
jgi:hypothetical protein